MVMYRGSIAGEFLNTGDSLKGAIGACMQGLAHNGDQPE
jgi:hypothetical protein